MLPGRSATSTMLTFPYPRMSLSTTGEKSGNGNAGEGRKWIMKRRFTTSPRSAKCWRNKGGFQVVIEKVCLYRLKVPLKQPYKIASAEMKAFDCTLVVLHSAGQEGIGEAMSGVAGYFWETPDGVWNFAREKGKKLLGKKLPEAHGYISFFKIEQPCAATPFLSAVEVLSQSPALKPPSWEAAVPMVGILQALDPAGIEQE